MKSLIVLLWIFSSLSAFALTTGRPAPDFKLSGISTKSKDVSLSKFRGKIVVLEWLNHGCPFVRKHYDSGNMQSLQKKYTEKNVVWLSIISSAKGKQGFVDAAGALKDKVTNKSSATDILLDTQGDVGHLYGAKTTPHLYIVDKDGILAYQGAIDNKADTEKSSVLGAKNFVAQALDEILDEKKVTVGTTKAYGCSVKY